MVAGMLAQRPGALNLFMGRFSPFVSGIAGAVLSSPEDVAEVCQDVFLKASQAIATFDPRRASLATWLGRIAYNTALNAARSVSRRAPTVSLDSSGVPPIAAEPPAEPDPRIDLLRRALDGLPPPDFIERGEMEDLDREFSDLVTARQAPVGKVSYTDNERLSGTLHLRPQTDMSVEGTKVELNDVPYDTWDKLSSKIRSYIGSHKEISVDYVFQRPGHNKFYINAYIVDYNTRVIYAWHYDGRCTESGTHGARGPLCAVRATYDGHPYLPENWWR